MPRPHLSDDGRTVTLDLHGSSVDDALDLVDGLVVEAARRGRSSVRVIHGTTSTDRGAERTIKLALYDALDNGAFDRHVTTDARMEGVLFLGLAPAPRPVQRRITLADLYCWPTAPASGSRPPSPGPTAEPSNSDSTFGTSQPSSGRAEPR